MITFDKLMDFIIEPTKAIYTVITGTILGYTPNVVNNTLGNDLSKIDTYFQHTVWTLTIIVALTAIISFSQKQYDRFKKIKKKPHDTSEGSE